MYMNKEREEAENGTKKNIFVHCEVNGNFTVFLQSQKKSPDPFKN